MKKVRFTSAKSPPHLPVKKSISPRKPSEKSPPRLSSPSRLSSRPSPPPPFSEFNIEDLYFGPEFAEGEGTASEGALGHRNVGNSKEATRVAFAPRGAPKYPGQTRERTNPSDKITLQSTITEEQQQENKNSLLKVQSLLAEQFQQIQKARVIADDAAERGGAVPGFLEWTNKDLAQLHRFFFGSTVSPEKPLSSSTTSTSNFLSTATQKDHSLMVEAGWKPIRWAKNFMGGSIITSTNNSSDNSRSHSKLKIFRTKSVNAQKTGNFLFVRRKLSEILGEALYRYRDLITDYQREVFLNWFPKQKLVMTMNMRYLAAALAWGCYSLNSSLKPEDSEETILQNLSNVPIDISPEQPVVKEIIRRARATLDFGLGGPELDDVQEDPSTQTETEEDFWVFFCYVIWIKQNALGMYETGRGVLPNSPEQTQIQNQTLETFPFETKLSIHSKIAAAAQEFRLKNIWLLFSPDAKSKKRWQESGMRIFPEIFPFEILRKSTITTTQNESFISVSNLIRNLANDVLSTATSTSENNAPSSIFEKLLTQSWIPLRRANILYTSILEEWFIITALEMLKYDLESQLPAFLLFLANPETRLFAENENAAYSSVPTNILGYSLYSSTQQQQLSNLFEWMQLAILEKDEARLMIQQEANFRSNFAKLLANITPAKLGPSTIISGRQKIYLTSNVEIQATQQHPIDVFARSQVSQEVPVIRLVESKNLAIARKRMVPTQEYFSSFLINAFYAEANNDTITGYGITPRFGTEQVAYQNIAGSENKTEEHHITKIFSASPDTLISGSRIHDAASRSANINFIMFEVILPSPNPNENRKELIISLLPPGRPNDGRDITSTLAETAYTLEFYGNTSEEEVTDLLLPIIEQTFPSLRVLNPDVTALGNSEIRGKFSVLGNAADVINPWLMYTLVTVQPVLSWIIYVQENKSASQEKSNGIKFYISSPSTHARNDDQSDENPKWIAYFEFLTAEKLPGNYPINWVAQSQEDLDTLREVLSRAVELCVELAENVGTLAREKTPELYFRFFTETNQKFAGIGSLGASAGVSAAAAVAALEPTNPVRIAEPSYTITRKINDIRIASSPGIITEGYNAACNCFKQPIVVSKDESAVWSKYRNVLEFENREYVCPDSKYHYARINTLDSTMAAGNSFPCCFARAKSVNVGEINEIKLSKKGKVLSRDKKSSNYIISRSSAVDFRQIGFVPISFARVLRTLQNFHNHDFVRVGSLAGSRESLLCAVLTGISEEFRELANIDQILRKLERVRSSLEIDTDKLRALDYSDIGAVEEALEVNIVVVTPSTDRTGIYNFVEMPEKVRKFDKTAIIVHIGTDIKTGFPQFEAVVSRGIVVNEDEYWLQLYSEGFSSKVKISRLAKLSFPKEMAELCDLAMDAQFRKVELDLVEKKSLFRSENKQLGMVLGVLGVMAVEMVWLDSDGLMRGVDVVVRRGEERSERDVVGRGEERRSPARSSAKSPARSRSDRGDRGDRGENRSERARIELPHGFTPILGISTRDDFAENFEMGGPDFVSLNFQSFAEFSDFYSSSDLGSSSNSNSNKIQKIKIFEQEELFFEFSIFFGKIVPSRNSENGGESVRQFDSGSFAAIFASIASVASVT